MAVPKRKTSPVPRRHAPQPPGAAARGPRRMRQLRRTEAAAPRLQPLRPLRRARSRRSREAAAGRCPGLRRVAACFWFARACAVTGPFTLAVDAMGGDNAPDMVVAGPGVRGGTASRGALPADRRRAGADCAAGPAQARAGRLHGAPRARRHQQRHEADRRAAQPAVLDAAGGRRGGLRGGVGPGLGRQHRRAAGAGARSSSSRCPGSTGRRWPASAPPRAATW